MCIGTESIYVCRCTEVWERCMKPFAGLVYTSACMNGQIFRCIDLKNRCLVISCLHIHNGETTTGRRLNVQEPMSNRTSAEFNGWNGEGASAVTPNFSMRSGVSMYGLFANSFLGWTIDTYAPTYSILKRQI